MEIEILYIIIGRVAKYRFDSLLLPMQCINLLPYNIYRYNISNRVFPSQQSPFEQNSIKKATTRSLPRVIKGGRLKISIDTIS